MVLGHSMLRATIGAREEHANWARATFALFCRPDFAGLQVHGKAEHHHHYWPSSTVLTVHSHLQRTGGKCLTWIAEGVARSCMSYLLYTVTQADPTNAICCRKVADCSIYVEYLPTVRCRRSVMRSRTRISVAVTSRSTFPLISSLPHLRLGGSYERPHITSTPTLSHHGNHAQRLPWPGSVCG